MNPSIKSIFIALSLASLSCNNPPRTPNSATRTVPPKIATIPKQVDTVEKSCQELVYQILTTSPHFRKITDGLEQRIIKNGGQGYGTMLEGSPNPEKDKANAFSKTYDYNLHESYKERITVINRFTFDPTNEKLLEYDVVNGTLLAIEFDPSLLENFRNVCK